MNNSAELQELNVVSKTTLEPVMPDRVPCNICQKEIPVSEAMVAEATDYVAYFCGLDFYDRWRKL